MRSADYCCFAKVRAFLRCASTSCTETAAFCREVWADVPPEGFFYECHIELPLN